MKEQYFFNLLDIENNIFYFSDFYTKQICSFSEDTKLINYDFNCNIDDIKGIERIIGIYSLGDLILLCPWNKVNFLLLYKQTKKISKKQILNFSSGYLNFRNDDLFQYQNSVYIISDNVIIKSNCLFDKFEFLLQIGDNDKSCGHGQIICLDTKLYIPIQNIIYIFDMLLEKICDEMIFNNCEMIETLCYIEENFWFITSRNKIVKYDGKSDISYDLPFETSFMLGDKKIAKFARCYVYGKYIWFLPLYTDVIIRMDIEKKLIEKVEIDEEKENVFTIQKKERKCIQKYLGITRNGNSVFFLSSKTENLYKLDLEKETIKLLDLSWNKEINNLIFTNKDSSALFCEGYLGVTIKEFIDIVCAG